MPIRLNNLPLSRRAGLIAVCGVFAALLFSGAAWLLHAQVEDSRTALDDFLATKNSACPKFVNVTGYTMTDECTGLTWARHQLPTYDRANDLYPGYTWSEANGDAATVTGCSDLSPAGMFRLPTTEELLTLVRTSCTGQSCAVGSPLLVRDGRDGADTLVGPQSPYRSDSFADGLFWSSSPYSTDARYARTVNLRTGAVDAPVFGKELRLNAWCVVNKTPELKDWSIADQGVSAGKETKIYRRRCSPADESVADKKCSHFIPGSVCVVASGTSTGYCQTDGAIVSRASACPVGTVNQEDPYHEQGNHFEGTQCIPNLRAACVPVNPVPQAIYKDVWVGNQYNGGYACSFVGCTSDADGDTYAGEADDYHVVRNAQGEPASDANGRLQCEARYQSVANGMRTEANYLSLVTERDRHCVGTSLFCDWTPWVAVTCVPNATPDGAGGCRCVGDSATGQLGEYVRTTDGAADTCMERRTVRTLGCVAGDTACFAQFTQFPFVSQQHKSCDGTWQSCAWTPDWITDTCVPNATLNGSVCSCNPGYGDINNNGTFGDFCGRAEICGNGIDDDGVDGDAPCTALSLTLRDDGVNPADDSFSLFIDGIDRGKNDLGSTLPLTIAGLTPGIHDMRVYFSNTSGAGAGSMELAYSPNFIWDTLPLMNDGVTGCTVDVQKAICDFNAVGDYFDARFYVYDPRPTTMALHATAVTVTPHYPTTIAGLSITVSSKRVRLNWASPSVAGQQATSYEIRYRTAANPFDWYKWNDPTTTAITTWSSWGGNTGITTTQPPKTTGASESATTGILPTGTYYFAIRAVNADGDEQWVLPSSTNNLSYSNCSPVTTPCAIVDLDTSFTTYPAEGQTPSTVTLQWDAPSISGSNVAALAYDMRYTVGTPLTEANWATATVLTGIPTPAQPGNKEKFVMKNLWSNAPYYFGIKAQGLTIGGQPYWSATPDVVFAKTPESVWVGVYTSGATTVRQEDPAINFGWGTGQLNPGIAATDNVNIVWTKYDYFAPGDYLFTTYADEAMRLYVDGSATATIDDNFTGAPRYNSAVVTVAAAKAMKLQANYAETTGSASARVSYTIGYQSGGPVGGTDAGTQYSSTAVFPATPAAASVFAGIPAAWAKPIPDNYSTTTASKSLSRYVSSIGTGLPGAGTFYFRRRFDLPAETLPGSTTIVTQLFADDNALLTLNGSAFSSAYSTGTQFSGAPKETRVTGFGSLNIAPVKNDLVFQVENPPVGGSNYMGLDYRLFVFPGVAGQTLYQPSRDFGGTQGYRGWSYIGGTAPIASYVPGSTTVAAAHWEGTTVVASKNYPQIFPGSAYPAPTGNNAVYRWTATKSGNILIGGSAGDEDPTTGTNSNGIIARIIYQPVSGPSVTLWNQTIPNGSGGNYHLTQFVNSGDTIDFVIDANGANDYDSTYFDPAILYTSIIN